MKKFLLTLLAFVACSAIAMADAVVAFGTNNDGRAFTAQTILSSVNGWESEVLPDGNRVAITQDPAGMGKFWGAQAVAGTWENETALAALNEFTGITFTAADMSEGTSLKVAANSNGGVNAILNLILDAQSEGDLVTLYTTVSGWNCPLDEITVTGLNDCVIKYAPGDGGGFYDFPVFTQTNQGLNLIVITGKLTAAKLVTVTSPTMALDGSKTKVGFQIAAYKVEAPQLAINSMAVVGTFPGMTWDPTQGVAMTQDAENPAIWTVTMENVELAAQTYEYKVAANGNWDDYVLPSGDNATFTFGTDEYPAGIYNLTFTADTENHTLAVLPVLVPQQEDDIYTITGAVADAPYYGVEEPSFFGTAWDATVTANDLVKGEDGLYTKTYENVYLLASHFIFYQVVKNRTETLGNKKREMITSDGFYNVTFTFNPETNAVTCAIEAAAAPEPVYTLVGGVNTTEGGQEDVLFGTSWDPTLEANDMEKGADGIYTKSFEKVALSYGDQILYKVAKNHAWSETWGFGTENADYGIQDDGEYNITFKFNPNATFSNGFNVDVVVEKIQPVLNTYEVYVANVPSDFGRPYAYVWSVVDGVDVPVTAWPGTRMSPWQFDNGDMGYIFQVQAAEAPQFIIFNNGQGGDGNQTADLEFVNRQTYDLTELMTPVKTGETVVTFGNANPGRDYITDPFVVSNVINFEADLKDGTHLLLSHNSEGNPNGKFWNASIAGEWTNSAAIDALNEALGTAFVDADFAAGTNLATCDPGPGDAHSLLTLTFANAEKNTLELYVSMTGRNGVLDNVTVTGLDNMIISYAVGNGDGFVSEPTFSPVVLGATLVKIQGYLQSNKQVTVTSTSMAGEASAKNGFQMAAYKITDEVLPVPTAVYTLVGDEELVGSSWDVNDTDNELTDNEDGTFSITKTNLSLTAKAYPFKIVTNHSWDNPQFVGLEGQFAKDADGNALYELFEAGTYDFTFILTPETGDLQVIVNKVITLANEYTTVSSKHDLDWTGMDVYYATVNNDKVLLKKFNGKAAAGTGLLLRGAAGDVLRPVITNAEGNAPSGNKFVGVTEATTIGEGNNYVLSAKDGVIGFYKVVSNVQIPAGKAYLHTDAPLATVGSNARVEWIFDDAATGIEDITPFATNGEVYDLQGRRVADGKCQRGLYIVNGKKFMVK